MKKSKKLFPELKNKELRQLEYKTLEVAAYQRGKRAEAQALRKKIVLARLERGI